MGDGYDRPWFSISGGFLVYALCLCYSTRAIGGYFILNEFYVETESIVIQRNGFEFVWSIMTINKIQEIGNRNNFIYIVWIDMNNVEHKAWLPLYQPVTPLNNVLGFMLHIWLWALRWRHNECDGVSNHQPHDCLLNLLFRRRSKKTSKLRVTGLCAGCSPVTGEFPAQRASNAENVSIWWRHNGWDDVPVLLILSIIAGE